jgi:hypothetical protein
MTTSTEAEIIKMHLAHCTFDSGGPESLRQFVNSINLESSPKLFELVGHESYKANSLGS